MVWTDFELWCASNGHGTVALRTSANGGFMRKTNANSSLQHAYGTARGVGGVRQTRPSQEKSEGQVAVQCRCANVTLVISLARVQCGIRESAGDGFGGESVNFQS